MINAWGRPDAYRTMGRTGRDTIHTLEVGGLELALHHTLKRSTGTTHVKALVGTATTNVLLQGDNKVMREGCYQSCVHITCDV